MDTVRGNDNLFAQAAAPGHRAPATVLRVICALLVFTVTSQYDVVFTFESLMIFLLPGGFSVNLTRVLFAHLCMHICQISCSFAL